jgi:zinc transport system permease protein
MISFLEALFSHPFLFMALLAGFLAAIAGGIMGTYVVTKRIAFISGSISHSILAGVGVSIFLLRCYHIAFLSPLVGALIVGILSALVTGWIYLTCKERQDSALAAIWSVGMALGILFLSKTPGFSVELSNFLIGNILWVQKSDLVLLASFDAVILVTVFFLHTRFAAICFDEQQATLQGIRVKSLYFLLLTLIAITTVILMQVVGIILVLTALTLPSAIAGLFTKSLSEMMWLGVALNFACMFFGLFLAYTLNFPVGATIALLAGCAYIFALVLKSKKPQVVA